MTTGHRHSLPRLIGLLHNIEYRTCNVDRLASAIHRYLTLIESANILHILSSRHLTRAQILNEQSLFGIAPQRTVEEVSGADRIYLDIVRNKLKCD